MKKLIFSFFLCGATMFPAFSQTYQELSERAVAALSLIHISEPTRP